MQHSAPVYLLADEQRSRSESAAWSSFTTTRDAAELHAAWLVLLAARIPRARAALLLTREGAAGAFAVAAAWPDPRRDLREMGAAAERALREGCGVATDVEGEPPRPGAPSRLAFPIEAEGRALAVVVLDLADGSRAVVQAGLRALHWASGWLLAHLESRRRLELQQTLSHSRLLNELSAHALQHERLRASALAVANQIAAHFGCSRVSVGFERGGSVRPMALSNTAHFDHRSDAVRTLADMMDEALDLGRPLASAQAPVAIDNGDAASADAAAGALVQTGALRRLEVAAVAAVPVRVGTQAVGALALERAQGPAFSADELAQLERLGTWLAPVWSLQQARERPLHELARERALAALPQWRRPGRMLIGSVAALALLAAVWVPLPHRVSARASLEGLSQRSVLAPFDGYIAESHVQAGDTVKAGQPLARLDDRELRLEVARWEAEREQQRRRVQLAMAQGDRAAQGIATAQVAQSDAMLALARDRLQRATLVAPHDAIVVAGDWRQHIGAAVENGRTMFELAPPDGHRVVLKVDDADLAWVSPGQRGELVLASVPQRRWSFTVTRVMPVATPADGRNVFRVEATLEDGDERLRPGMEGIGKVQVGERSALWVWTHRLWDWLRIATWGWAP